MTCERLADTRKSITHKLVVLYNGERIHVYITAGLYQDGRPGEVFLNIDDANDTVRGWAKQWAISMSLCLQNGVKLAKLVEKFAHHDFPPNGFTESADIRSCTSISDYVVRWMALQFNKEH